MSEVEYEDTPETEVSATSSQDVASIIEQGLSELNRLKAEVITADKSVEDVRADVSDKLAEYKRQAAEAVAEARAEQSAAIEAVKSETDAQVREVRDSTAAQVAQAKESLDAQVAEAVASASGVKASYADAITRLTQWLAPAALASMGHSVSRRGRKSQ